MNWNLRYSVTAAGTIIVIAAIVSWPAAPPLPARRSA
jgi:hypothetical protein